MMVLIGAVGAVWLLGRLAKMWSHARQNSFLATHHADEEARERLCVWASGERDEQDDFWNPG